jgi:hypothetical protein
MRTVRLKSDIKDVEGEAKRWMKPTSTEPTYSNSALLTKGPESRHVSKVSDSGSASVRILSLNLYMASKRTVPEGATPGFLLQAMLKI